MRCYICNRVIDEPSYNRDHRDFDPCNTCKAVVADLLASYADQPAPDEDELCSDEPILQGLFPPSYDPFGIDENNP